MIPAVDILPDEGTPLLNCNNCSSDYEVVPVHCHHKPVITDSANYQKRWSDMTVDYSDCRYSRCMLPSDVDFEDNVVGSLQAFWQKKAQQAKQMLRAGNPSTVQDIKYEVEPVTADDSCYVCYVVLPGGCCFASPLDYSSPVEAQREAARIALINSVLNELPSRRITESVVEMAVSEAAQIQTNGQELEAYQFVLESSLEQTVLDYTSLISRLRIMHWSGRLQTLNGDGATRQDVLRMANSDHWLSDEFKSAMASHWVTVENSESRAGSVKCELEKALKELNEARRCGQDVTFPRLKRDVLRIAANRLMSKSLLTI